jgi:hypothetical protein
MSSGFLLLRVDALGLRGGGEAGAQPTTGASFGPQTKRLQARAIAAQSVRGGLTGSVKMKGPPLTSKERCRLALLRLRTRRTARCATATTPISLTFSDLAVPPLRVRSVHHVRAEGRAVATHATGPLAAATFSCRASGDCSSSRRLSESRCRRHSVRRRTLRESLVGPWPRRRHGLVLTR